MTRARHRAPAPARSGRRPSSTRALAGVGLVLAAGIAVLGNTVSAEPTAAAYTDTARAVAPVAGYTVPAPISTDWQISGTGESIQSRLKVACDAPSGLWWRWRDHMTEWGDAWNAWSAWSNAASEPGWTGWSTSHLMWAGMPAEVQWDVRCGYATWTGTSSTRGPVTIVRTT